MEAFTIKIAEQAIRVQPLFESTREYCRAFLTEKDPALAFCVSHDDLTFEQILLEQEAAEEGLRIRKFQGPFLERSFIQRKVADYLLQHDTILMHGSTVAVDSKAFLFTAPCGTGKSTHTRLWREAFGHRAAMVNDDKAFLRITSSGILVYGSPWCGKHGLGTNICVPLQGICLLRRGSENVIHRAVPACALGMLRKQTHTPMDSALIPVSDSLLETLTERVSLWEMDCNKDVEAAMVSYSAMCRDD